MRIQVDMFDVQLGAAILIQFKTPSGPVRVLADAGEEKHKIKPRLLDSMSAFAGGERRIDLIIGTHYDADHLDGLVEIIKDTSIKIGEAWLPPVANDTEARNTADTLSDEELLGLQFRSADGEAVLARYLQSKAELMEKAAQLRDGADPAPRSFRRAQESGEDFFKAGLEGAQEKLRSLRRVESPTSVTNHGDDEVDDPFDDTIEELLKDGPRASRFRVRELWNEERPESFLGRAVEQWRADPVLRRSAELGFAKIEGSAARDAINAKSLKRVVDALAERRIPMRFATIRDGIPRRFVWNTDRKKFVPATGSDAASGNPVMTLLAPSDGLVRKHRDKIPIGDYALAFARTSIPIVSVTESNQLSYVMRFDHEEQSILISGDAACVDFKPGRNKPYFEKLLAELAPLNIVQVAHHGGANGHFYRCLLESAFPDQIPPAFLLLSHETASSSRPSPAFSMFMQMMEREAGKLPLLFTSQPKEVKVRDVVDHFHKTVGPSSSSGDVSLTFDNDWKVIRHAVEPPPP